MARVFSLDGYIAADGLQGCTVCDEAMQLAWRLADEWGEPVELEDDDGNWHVYPAGDDGVRPVATAVADDYAVCEQCGEHAAFHGEGCR